MYRSVVEHVCQFVNGCVELDAGVAANPGRIAICFEKITGTEFFSIGCPPLTALDQNSLSSETAFMNSSVTRTE